MRWWVWWQILLALQARSIGQLMVPTICDDAACHCDAFTRVICNCTDGYDGVLFRPDGVFRLPSMVTSIIIDGCARIQFMPETITNLQRLQLVEIRNVASLVIQERSLVWPPPNTNIDNTPGLRILIHNSTIDEIFPHAVQGRVSSLVIRNCNLTTVRPFAFSSLTGVVNVELMNNRFGVFATQAFKQVTTSNFIIRGGHIHALPSRVLTEVEVTGELRVEGVNVDIINSLAFKVTMPERVIFENNIFGLIEGDAFKIITRGPITFRNNFISFVRQGVFNGFSVLREVTSVKGRQELLIENNTIISGLSPTSLMYERQSLTMRLNELNMNYSCTCKLVEEWRNVTKEQSGTINCWYELEGYFISLSAFFDSRCGKFKQTFWIFVVIGILIILLLAALGLFFIMKREREKKRKGRIVMPDGKTYRETEFHIVVERMELLTTNL